MSRIPAPAAGQKVRRIAVFGLPAVVEGFGPTTTGVGFYTFGVESTRGAFRPTSSGTWVRDPALVPAGGLVRKTDLLGIQTGPSQYIALETWHWRK